MEIGLGYLKGKDHKIESRIYYNQYGINEVIDRQIKAPMVLLQPSLLLRANPKTFTPYARLGAVWAFGSIREKIDDKLWIQKVAIESFYTGSGFGLQGGLGLDIKANEEVTFFAEATFNNLTYTPDKWEMTKATLDEVSFLYTDIPKNERETVFVESVSRTYNDRGELVVNPDEPSQEKRVHFPFTAIGLGLGIKVSL